MAIWTLSLLFAGAALAHTGVKTIVIDGVIYPPFDGRIDHLVGPVRRIEWTRDIVGGPFQPITNFSDPALACRANAKQPALTAPVRAGAEVNLFWTAITRMHNGPALAYLAPNPSANTTANDLKFFKIYESGFIPSADRWANELASDNGDSFKIQLPSDIKPGPYVLRTELIALHGNMNELKQGGLKGQIQIYLHCFNINVVGSGTATPEGVSFPGAYKPDDAAFKFNPYMTYGIPDPAAAMEHNSKYIPPGPPRYAGKYDLPTGPRIEVKETGQYAPALETTYQDLIKKIERPALKLATYINAAWPHYKADEVLMKGFGSIGAAAGKEGKAVMDAIKPEIEAFKKASHTA